MIPAIQSGIDARDYWLLTLGEIQATIQAYNRNIEIKTQMSRATAYTTAVLTANFVGLSLNGKPIPSYEECFDTSTDTSTTGGMSAATKRYQQQWSAFAIEHNARRRKKLGG